MSSFEVFCSSVATWIRLLSQAMLHRIDAIIVLINNEFYLTPRPCGTSLLASHCWPAWKREVGIAECWTFFTGAQAGNSSYPGIINNGAKESPTVAFGGGEKAEGNLPSPTHPGEEERHCFNLIQRLYFANVHSLMVLLFSVLFTGNKVRIEFSSVRRTYPVQFQIDLHAK